MKSLITRCIIVTVLVISSTGSLQSQEVGDTVSNIKLPSDFSASTFYSGIPSPDGIAARKDGSLLVVNERNPSGVFIARKGDIFDPGDAYTTTGAPFRIPDDVLVYPDGTVFVVDGSARALLKIEGEGMAPSILVTREDSDSNVPFSLNNITVAPPSFKGPHVNPGDLIVCSFRGLTVYAINPSTGRTQGIVEGSNFDENPLSVAFGPDGRLFVYQSFTMGNSTIVCVDAEGNVTPFLPSVPDRGRMDINPVTGDIYFGLQENIREIWCISREGGYPRVFASGFPGRFQGMQFSPDGKTLYVSHPNSIIEITGPFLEPIRGMEIALGSVSGTVTKADEKEACAHMELGVVRDDNLVGSTLTDEVGQYHLMLPPGDYTVMPMPGQGHEPSGTSMTVIAGKETRTDLTVTPFVYPMKLTRLEQGDWTTFATEKKASIGAIEFTPDGTLWCVCMLSAGGASIAHFDDAALTHYTKENGLVSNQILWTDPLAITPDGVLWVGTAGDGISRFDGETWTAFTTDDGLLSNDITAVALAPNGDLWCGHPFPNAGVSRFDGEVWTAYSGAEIGIARPNVIAIAVTPEGTLWVGGSFGVSRYNGETWTHYTTELGMEPPIIEAIVPASDGTVWVGGNGVSRYNGDTWTHYSFEDMELVEVEGYGVFSLATEPDGTLWVGAMGVSRYDGEHWINYTEDNGLGGVPVMSIEVASDGAIWFGTGGGISRFLP